MKIIIDTALKKDNVTSITASSADTNFPAANLQDDFTTNIWRAAAGGTTGITLTIVVAKGSAIELLNTNAISASMTVDPGGGAVAVPITSYKLSGEAGRLWAEYGPYTGSHTIVLTLSAASEVSAGILRAGNVETFIDPQYNSQEDSKDYSIELELNDGSNYFRKRNVVRQFSSLAMIELRANAFKFKHDIFDAVGPQPLAMRLADKKITDAEFVLFAKRINAPKLTHLSPIYTKIDFDLKEVV
jgi:hypothetical protein